VVEAELQYDANTGVSLIADLVATTATLSAVKPDGVELEAPAVTISAISTTIAAGTTKTVLTLAAITGIAPGSPLIVTSDGVAYACEAAVVDAAAKTVDLRVGLPVVPDTGAAVKGALLTATVAAPGVANIGPNFRLRWSYDDGATYRVVTVPAAVVRQAWTSPINAADVRDVLAEMGTSRSDQWCAAVASRVDDMVRARLVETNRRPWMYLSSAAFRRCSLAGIRFELAQRGMAHGGQVYEAQRELRFSFDDALASAIGGIIYDADGDGVIDASETKPMHFTAQATR